MHMYSYESVYESGSNAFELDTNCVFICRWLIVYMRQILGQNPVQNLS